MKKPPCFGCTTRSQGCHVDCKEYQHFKTELERINLEKYKANLAQDYTSEQIDKEFHKSLICYSKRNRRHYR